MQQKSELEGRLNQLATNLSNEKEQQEINSILLYLPKQYSNRYTQLLQEPLIAFLESCSSNPSEQQHILPILKTLSQLEANDSNQEKIAIFFTDTQFARKYLDDLNTFMRLHREELKQAVLIEQIYKQIPLTDGLLNPEIYITDKQASPTDFLTFDTIYDSNHDSKLLFSELKNNPNKTQILRFIAESEIPKRIKATDLRTLLNLTKDQCHVLNHTNISLLSQPTALRFILDNFQTHHEKHAKLLHLLLEQKTFSPIISSSNQLSEERLEALSPLITKSREYVDEIFTVLKKLPKDHQNGEFFIELMKADLNQLRFYKQYLGKNSENPKESLEHIRKTPDARLVLIEPLIPKITNNDDLIKILAANEQTLAAFASYYDDQTPIDIEQLKTFENAVESRVNIVKHLKEAITKNLPLEKLLSTKTALLTHLKTLHDHIHQTKKALSAEEAVCYEILLDSLEKNPNIHSNSDFKTMIEFYTPKVSQEGMFNIKKLNKSSFDAKPELTPKNTRQRP